MSVNLGGMQSLSMLMGGIDYSQIIQQLTAANRAPGDALNQTIQTYQLKSNDWSNIASLASKVQDDLVTLASTSTFQSYTAAVSGTDASDVTATTSSSASPGTYNISITKVGTQATLTGGAQLGRIASVNDQITNSEFSQPISTGTITATVGNNTYSYTAKSTDTIQSVMQGLFGSVTGVSWSIPTTGTNANELLVTNSGGQQITFGSAGDSSNFFQVLGLSGQPAAAGATVPSSLIGHAQLNNYLNNGNFAAGLQATSAGSTNEMDINGVAITYNTGKDTLQAIIGRINASQAGVIASYDPIADKVVLTSATSQPITVTDKTGNLGQVLGLTSQSSVAPVSAAGQPWNYSINNGTVQTTASATVTNAIPGVSFTMQAAPGAISGSVTSLNATITITQDTSSLTKAVNAFVTDFNNLYSQLQKYTQLHGDLQGDAAMAQLGFEYMNDVLSSVPKTSQFAQQSVMGIGISNGAVGSAPGTTNNLQVDTTKLTTAFQNDPNEVQALLQGMSTRLNSDLTNLTGQFNTLTPISSSNQNMTGVGQSEENLYSNMITDVEQQQQTIYDRATQEEQLLVEQFTQLQQYQSDATLQQNAIRGMLGTITG